MNGKRALMIAVLALVCLAIASGATLGASSEASTQGAPAPGSAGGYRLETLSWKATGTLSGPGYLLGGTITGTGTPCCCSYLPCIVRGAP
jgi:hypothetical protein